MSQQQKGLPDWAQALLSFSYMFVATLATIVTVTGTLTVVDVIIALPGALLAAMKELPGAQIPTPNPPPAGT